MTTNIERVFGGKYEIFRELGRGGMSVVYLAMDKNLNKQWAIKEIKKRAKDKHGDVYVQTLMTEANLMKRLDHPAIPRIVDIVEDSEAIYVVMDYVEGESLDKVLEKFGPQPQEVVLDWAKQLADALYYLHSQNPPIIYRDMKPANVMLKPEGTVKMIDFGTAREYKGNKSSDTVAFVTRGYAAPEQYEKRETDARTDIYCLGKTLHHLLTGQNPCDEDYEYFPVRHWNPEIHEGIERIIEKCVRPDPEDRFQSCTELLYALENYEYDTAEYKKQQKKKVKLFFAIAGLSLAMFLVSLGSLITFKTIQKNNYEELINTPKSQSFQTKIEAYTEAVHIDPSKLGAYEALLEAYEDNGKFGNKNGSTLAALFGEYSGDRNTEEYVDMCYRVGFMYFNFYTENGNNSFQAKVVKSASYFKEVHEILENNSDISFDQRNAAESYYTVTSFYKSNNGMQLAKAHTLDELRELLSAFSKCMDELDNFDESNDPSAQAIKLSQYSSFANQINELRNEFAAVKVSESEVQSLINEIESAEKRITLGELDSKREKALAEISSFRENISRAYLD